MSLEKTFDCAAPVALVTGSAAPRVGRAIALRLAAGGCRIAIHAGASVDQGNQIAKQLKDQGIDAIVVQANMQDSVAVEAMVAETIKHFGRLDILVNSAAIWKPTRLEEVTADEIRHNLEVNTVGCFVAARAAGLQMVSQSSGGVIINISDWATTRPYLDHAAYFPSKGAVETMTRSLAVELATRNPRVRVNCIQPGPVMLAEGVDDSTRQQLENAVLLKRIGTAEEVAHAVEFLCENQFITGVLLPVDGGKSIYANDGMQNGLNTG